MPVVLYVLLGLLVLLLVSGGYVFFVGCFRGKEVQWLDETAVKKTPYGKYSDCIVASDQWLKSHNAQDIYVESHDGLKLHGLWVPVEQSKGTILLAHGYRSSMLIDFHLFYEAYHRLGLNLLIPEQRAHGQSEGRFITFGVKESKDMLRWLAFHNRTFGRQPLILSGISMGASTIMYMADRRLPENVCGIIVDCGFTSPKDILSSVFKRVTHLPAGPSVYVAELFARVFAGFSLWEKDSRKTLAKNCLPILMIHGMDDGFVPCEMTKQAFSVCTGPKQLLLVEGAEHGLSILIDRVTYLAAVTKFLRDNLKSI